MRTSFATQVPKEIRATTPSTKEDDDSKIKAKKTSHTSKEESDKNLRTEDESSSIHISDSDSSDDGCIKPVCSLSVNHIISTLSAVSTFGGLALIITGGMGMTLEKPVDNTMQNMAMILSGGALLVGSWIGNVAYANHQSA